MFIVGALGLLAACSDHDGEAPLRAAEAAFDLFDMEVIEGGERLVYSVLPQGEAQWAGQRPASIYQSDVPNEGATLDALVVELERLAELDGLVVGECVRLDEEVSFATLIRKSSDAEVWIRLTQC